MSEEYLTLREWDAHDRRLTAELQSAKEAVAIAATASKEALNKAEQAQNEYNKFHNELQRKMDDERGGFVSRREFIWFIGTVVTIGLFILGFLLKGAK